MLDTTIPKGMASSIKLASDIEGNKQIHQLWYQNMSERGKFTTIMKTPNIEDTGQPHKSWYQHMNKEEKIATAIEGILMITIMTLINFAVSHTKLKIGRILTKMALISTLIFHTPISDTLYYIYPVYILLWITWVLYKEHKRDQRELKLHNLHPFQIRNINMNITRPYNPI